MPGTDWRSFVAGKFHAAVSTGSLLALGQGLHALQDAYAHDLAGAGMWAHIAQFFGGVNPDDPDLLANEGRATAATAATTNYIRDFMKARGDKAKCPAAEVE